MVSTLRKYRIPPGKSINVGVRSGSGKQTLLKLLTGPQPSGRIVTADDVPAEMIASYVKHGFLVPLGEMTPLPEGIEGAVLGIDSVREDSGHQKRMPLTVPEEVQAKSPKRHRARTPWDTAPEKLLGKSLDVLNFMVAERDAHMDPFETVEEAIAQLTKDYQGPIG